MAEESTEKTGEQPEIDLTPAVDTIKAALEKTQIVFEGHPSEAAPLGGPGEKPEEPLADTVPEPGATEPEKVPSADLKFRDHLEAERGYKEVERLVGRKEAEKQALQGEVQRLTAELGELQKKVSDRKGEISKEEAATILYEGLKQMQEVEDQDPAYLEKISNKWADSILAIVEKVAARNVEEITEKAAERARQETRQADNEAAAWQYAVDTAKAAGLDMKYNIGKDEYGNPTHSDSYEVFWDSLRYAPQGETVEEQVQFAISRTKRILGTKASSPKAKAEAEKIQASQSPLVRHGEVPPRVEKPPEEPMTLKQALASSLQRRVI